MHIHRLEAGKQVHLKEYDANDTSGFSGSKDVAAQKLAELTAKLDALQENLYAEHRHKVLIVLQGMDTSGKDGTVRAIFDGMNPQGVRVTSFKVPTSEELDHDYLWRIHQEVPAKGQIVVFNRSHYEDVLVVRVHNIVSADEWKRRYDQINHFEKHLAQEGTLILKFFLHIDLDEQKQRLLERLDDPTKHWKFAPGDLEVRKQWDGYAKAYADAIAATGTPWAPWTIVPADSKTHRNLMIATAIQRTLKGLKLRYPPGDPALDKIKVV